MFTGGVDTKMFRFASYIPVHKDNVNIVIITIIAFIIIIIIIIIVNT